VILGLINVVAVVGLYIFMGNSGVLNFSSVAFMAIGAYTSVHLIRIGTPFELSMLAGGLASAAIGSIFGFAALRVKSLYLGDERVDDASAGDAVTLTLTDEIDIARGDMLARPEARPEVADAQARDVVGACHYPPDGYRSAGGVLAGGEPFCIVMAESAEAVADLDATLALDGVDGVYVGPRDLSYSLGCPLDPADPVLRPVLERIWAACAAAGKPVGVHATDGATARLYRDGGCSLITVASDGTAISRAAAAELGAARK